MGITAEICCGGYEDARTAAAYGAQRVELNSGLYLGGLTPGIGTLKLTKETTDLNVVSMVQEAEVSVIPRRNSARCSGMPRNFSRRGQMASLSDF